MALRFPMLTSPLGVGFPNAYARVARVSGDKNTLHVMVEIYADEAARQANARPVDTHVYPMATPANTLPYSVIYDSLKLLPEYAGAVDC